MINILNYSFEGWYPLVGTLFNEVSGVYVIAAGNVWLDVGETATLATRLGSHERKPDWQRNANGNAIHVAFLGESNQQTRLSIESYLRSSLNPLCGDR